jgi:hypothetical protein
MQLRRPTFPEILIQAVCLLLLGLFVFDYFDALSATSCSGTETTRNCFPWGGEGPVAGVWAYSSKDAYLRTATWRIALMTAAALAPFIARRPQIGGLMMIGLASAGLWLAEMLARTLQF